MRTAIVATAKVADLPALRGQLAKLTIGEPSYYLLQAPGKITDWRKGQPEAAEIEKYTRGRLFGKKAEIRWQKTAAGYALLWLSEGEPPEGFVSFGKWEMSESQNVFLLGGGEMEPWRDTRIPRKLNYPMDWCKFPKVKIIQYRDFISQTICFTRYTDFVK